MLNLHKHLWSFVNVFSWCFAFSLQSVFHGQKQWILWIQERREWCCLHAKVGCPSFQAPYNCKVQRMPSSKDVEALFLRQIGCNVGKQTRWEKVLLLVVFPFLLFSSFIIWQISFSSSMRVRSLGRSRAGQSGLRVTWLQCFVGLCLSFYCFEGTPGKLSEVALKSVLSCLII